MPEDSPHVEGFIEEPAPNGEVRALANIEGWAIDFSSGSSLEVEAFVDGHSIGSVQNDIPGPDVADFFAKIGISVPPRNRFLMSFDTKWLTRGWHTLRVVAKSASRETFELGQSTFRVVE